MPSPISASASRRDDASYDDPVGTCTSASENPPAAAPLWCPEEPPEVAHEADFSGVAPTPVDTRDNANRSGTQEVGPYAASGVTSDGYSVYVGVAALKGEDGKGTTEVATVSAQLGVQNEVQGALFRTGEEHANDGWTVEGASFRAAVGIHNPDGSVGANVATAVNIASVEGWKRTTLAGREATITMGASIGEGVDFSVGVRNRADGGHDVCLRGSIPVEFIPLLGLELGFCLER